MHKTKRILAIIPARGGSQGLPGKNIMPFAGKPLIAWTILQALSCKYIDKVVVSTDDDKIAAVSRKYGACVPFLRPGRIATSSSNMMDVIMHALDFLVRKEGDFDVVLLLQPTSPLRTSKDIKMAIELFFEKKASSLISVCPSEHHPWWSVALDKSSKIKKFLGLGKSHKNRQELPCFFRLNGAIYIAQQNFFRKERTFIAKNTYAYIMPPERSVDIDSRLDFDFAEFLAKKNYLLRKGSA